jgi:hypothetical protein
MDQATNCVMEYRPTWRERFWKFLGFGEVAIPKMDDLEGVKGFAPAYLTVRTEVVMGWQDRLRTLRSGRIVLKTCIKTDVQITHSVARSSMRVLPPHV